LRREEVQGVRVAEGHRVRLQVLHAAQVEAWELIRNVRGESEDLRQSAKDGGDHGRNVEIDEGDLVEREGLELGEVATVRLFEGSRIGGSDCGSFEFEVSHVFFLPWDRA
jgi:hypothetical protein